MKRLKHLSSSLWLVLVTTIVLTLAGCDTPIATPVSTTTPVQDTPTVQTPATIRGIITYQAPPTPTSMLYLISPERWYSLEVPSTSPSSTFEIQVVPVPTSWLHSPLGVKLGEFRPAAAYTTGVRDRRFDSRSRTGGGRHPCKKYQFRQLRYVYFPRLAGWTFPGFGRKLQQTPNGNSAGHHPRDHQLPSSAHARLHTLFHRCGAHVSAGSARRKPGGDFRATGGTRHLPIGGIPDWK